MPRFGTRSLAALALVAMLFRGLVPLGWMPAPLATGAFLVLCTGVEHAPGTRSGPGHQSLPQSFHDTICPYASAAPLANGPAIYVPAAPVDIVVAVEPADRGAAPLWNPGRNAHRPRAPPLVA